MIRSLAFTALAAALASCAAIDTTAHVVPSEKPATETVANIVAEAVVAPGPGGRMPSGRDLGTRSSVVAPQAAAATAHPLATQTALDVMKRGGSAVDAAIAANAMLGLVEPTGNGIGGDLFAIVWDPKTEKLYGYNGSGRSAKSATLADMQAKADEFMDGVEIPPFGAASVTVPGTVDGWYALHAKFGARLMNENLEPAIQYARNGAPIPEVIAYYWSRGPARYEPAFESGMLEEYANARATYFDPAPIEGTLFKNPDLADTLERIAYEGRSEFYHGETAHRMSEYFERIGGHLRYEDFTAHEGEWVEPICVPYRDTKVCELGENTQGIAALQMLQMLERFDLRDMGFGSADSLMAQVEAKRLAFADRAAGYADTEFSKIDPRVFVIPAYSRLRSETITLNMAQKNIMPGIPQNLVSGLQAPAEDSQEYLGAMCHEFDPDGMTDSARVGDCYMFQKKLYAADRKLEDGDTTYLTVTDKNGMMVSLIQSNYRGMGSGLVADGLGFMFQDRGQLFSLDENHPNVFEPGKRPFHTIIPAFAFKQHEGDYKPWLSFGLMGGGMQPQGHVQIILNLIDYDMGLQEAGDAARWEHVGGCEPTDRLEGDTCEDELGIIQIEGGITEATKRELEARGHTVKYVPANAGGYQAIMRDFKSGAWIAATEMRKDGAADGY